MKYVIEGIGIGFIFYVIYRLELIHLKIKAIMAKQEDFDAQLSKIDEYTTRIATAVTGVGNKIKSLEETIKTMGLSSNQEKLLLDKISSTGDTIKTLASALEEVAKDPANPTPVELPTEGEGTEGNTGGGTEGGTTTVAGATVPAEEQAANDVQRRSEEAGS